MSVPSWVLALTSAVALFGAACGGGDDATGPDDAPAEGSSAIEVTAVNFAFSPASVPVEAGAEIELTFTNDDDAQHSFTADDLGVDLVVDGGSSDSVTFTAPDSGGVEFVCKFHEPMKGTITTDGSAAGSGGSEDSGNLDY